MQPGHIYLVPISSRFPSRFSPLGRDSYGVCSPVAFDPRCRSPLPVTLWHSSLGLRSPLWSLSLVHCVLGRCEVCRPTRRGCPHCCHAVLMALPLPPCAYGSHLEAPVPSRAHLALDSLLRRSLPLRYSAASFIPSPRVPVPLLSIPLQCTESATASVRAPMSALTQVVTQTPRPGL